MRRVSNTQPITTLRGARRARPLRSVRPRRATVAAVTPALRGRLAAFVARHEDGRMAVLVARALVHVSARRAVVVRADASGRVTDVALAPELPVGRLLRLIAPLRAEGFRVRRVRPADARRALSGLVTGRSRLRRGHDDGLDAALELCAPRR